MRTIYSIDGGAGGLEPFIAQRQYTGRTATDPLSRRTSPGELGLRAEQPTDLILVDTPVWSRDAAARSVDQRAG